MSSTALRFLLAGGTAAAVTWLVRFPLSVVVPFWLAVCVSGLIGMVLGFILYRHFVFPASARGVWREIRDFLLVNLVTTLLVTAAAHVIALALVLYVDRTVAEAAAHAAAIAAGAFLNFLGHRIFTFQPTDPASRPLAVASLPDIVSRARPGR